MISLDKRTHLRRYLKNTKAIFNFSFQILLSFLVRLDRSNPDTCKAFSIASDISCINLAFICLTIHITANWLIAEQIDLLMLGIASCVVLVLCPLSLRLQLNFWAWLHNRSGLLFRRFFYCDNIWLRLALLFLLSMVFLSNCALLYSGI